MINTIDMHASRSMDHRFSPDQKFLIMFHQQLFFVNLKKQRSNGTIARRLDICVHRFLIPMGIVIEFTGVR
jgi:hypothetical protein